MIFSIKLTLHVDLSLVPARASSSTSALPPLANKTAHDRPVFLGHLATTRCQ
jgi:hypothetical protein